MLLRQIAVAAHVHNEYEHVNAGLKNRSFCQVLYYICYIVLITLITQQPYIYVSHCQCSYN